MKKYLSLLILSVMALSACEKKEIEDSGSGEFDSMPALKFKGTVPSLTADGVATDVQLSWTQGQSVGIIPVAAKAVATKASNETVYKYVVSETATTSLFEWTDYAFVPDEQIPVHKFLAFSPYSESAYNGDEIGFTLPAVQSGTDIMSYLPVYAEAEITEPIDGATVLMKFGVVGAAVLKIPRLESASKAVISAAVDAPVICGEADIDIEDGFVNVTSGTWSVEVSFDGESSSCNAVIYAGNHSGKEIKVVYTTASGEVEKIFEGADYQSGKQYALIAKDVAVASGYEIDLSSVDFSESFIYEAKDEVGKILAIITKEYLPASNQQAVVVYGTKQGTSSMVMDSGNPIGLVAKVLKSAPAGEYTAYTDVAASDPVHGGVYSFNSEVLNYTQAGTSAALDKVYVAYDETEKRTSVSAEGETSLKAQIVPRTLVLSDRGEDKAYKLVKIGRQIWFAENLETMKYNDGTPITKAAKAKELYSMTEAAYVNTASTTNRILYNIAAATSENFLPSGGWKLPTEGDFKNLIANVPQADMLTSFTSSETSAVMGHNITGFSITVRGRVTNNGWENTLDPTFWSSAASETAGKHKCLLVRMNDAQATAVPQVNAGQNDKFGFWVRLMRGLY